MANPATSPCNTHASLHIGSGQGFRGVVNSQKRPLVGVDKINRAGWTTAGTGGRGAGRMLGAQPPQQARASRLGEAASWSPWRREGAQHAGGGRRGLHALISLQSDSIPSEMDFLMRLLAALKTQIEFRRNGGRHQKTIWRLGPWGAGHASAGIPPPLSLSLALVRGQEETPWSLGCGDVGQLFHRNEPIATPERSHVL